MNQNKFYFPIQVSDQQGVKNCFTLMYEYMTAGELQLRAVSSELALWLSMKNEFCSSAAARVYIPENEILPHSLEKTDEAALKIYFKKGESRLGSNEKVEVITAIII